MKAYMRIFLIAICLILALLGVSYAESQSYRPTVKIKAGVLELRNSNGEGSIVDRTSDPYSLSSDWNKNLLAFQKLNLTRPYLAGDSRADINFEFVNPLAMPDYAETNLGFLPTYPIDPTRQGNDPKNNPVYWLLPIDMVTERTLSQYDLLLVPSSGAVFQLESISKPVKEWIQNGGILWYDAIEPVENNTNHKINLTPIPYLYLAGSANSSINYDNPVLDYPFYIDKSAIVNMANGGFVTGQPLGMEYSNFSFAFNNGNPSYAVINVGEGKVIFTFDKLSERVGESELDSSFDNYRKIAYNLFYYALGNNSGRTGKLAQLLGDSVFFTDAFSPGSIPKPIINANRVIYTADSGRVFIEGEELDGGDAPSGILSKPAVMGENDIVVYDDAGDVYIYTGITYNTDGSMNKSNAEWIKIYECGLSDTPEGNNEFINTDYAPLVRDNWIYFVDNKARLHSIYAKDLDSANKAQHTWTTAPAASAAQTSLIAAPVMSSRKDYLGAYITEISWILKDGANDNRSVKLSTVPVFIQDEVSIIQPMLNSSSTITLDYKGYPMWAANRMSIYQKENGGTVEAEFVDVICENTQNSNLPRFRLKNYTNDTNDWDFKTNYDKSGRSAGILRLNATANDQYFSLDSKIVKEHSEFRDISLSRLKFIITYAPKYTQAMNSVVNTNENLFEEGIFEYGGEGYLYSLKANNTSDNKGLLPYLLKSNMKYIPETRQFNRDLQWSYLIHTGFNNLTNPAGVETLYSHIDWGFPEGIDNVNEANVTMSNPSYIDGKVYIVATATLENINRTAVICLNSNPEPYVRVVDENGNPVHLFTRNPDGTNANLDLRVFQPDPADTNLEWNKLEFNIRDSSSGVIVGGSGPGKLTVTSIGYFKREIDGNKRVIYGGLTTALPLFVTIGGKYIPVKLDTTTMVDQQFNDDLHTKYGNGFNEHSVYDDSSDSNETKELWLDMSGWNQINWYSVLPGNVVGIGTPIATGEKVMLFAEVDNEKQINNKRMTVSRKLFTVSPKANLSGGVKASEDSISISGLPSSLRFHGNLKPVIGSNLIAIPSFINGTASVSLFENSRTLVVDNNKILEIDGNGEVTWRLTNPEIWKNSGSGWDVNNFSLDNPIKAKYLTDNNVSGKGTVVVADAGKKALMFFDRSGCIKSESYDTSRYNWYFYGFVDKYGLLGAGQPTNLSNISDFKIWTEEISANQTRYHMTIADSGNKRIVDLTFMISNGRFTECYTDNNGNVLPYLNWVSYDSIQDKRYKYVSLDVSEVVYHPALNMNMRVIVAGIANFNAAERNGLKKSKGGSVVMYSYIIDPSDAGQSNINDLRYGKSFDGIGKSGDKVGLPDTPIAIMAGTPKTNEIKGLKKIAIIDKGSATPYDFTDIGIVVCDDSGVIEYKVQRDATNTNTPKEAYSNGSYAWESKKYIPATFFGIENPTIDKLTAGSIFMDNQSVFLTSRIRPFSKVFYDRINFANGFSNKDYENNWMPLKAPIIPMDVKILPNGNWLVANGYSGNLQSRYQNPYDGNVYVAEGKYNSEILEFEFRNINSPDPDIEMWYPLLIWSSNNFLSYNIDDYIPGILKTGSHDAGWFSSREEQIKNWLVTLEDLDGFVYTDKSSEDSNNQPKSEIGKSIGGWKLKNTPLQSVKSADR